MKHDWKYQKLGEIISPAKVVRNGMNNKFPVLSITMHDGIVFQSSRFKKTIASVDTSDYKVVKNGQLVIAFPIDEGLIYTQDIIEAGIMSPAYNVWDVDFSEIDRRFLVLYLHCPFAMAYYKSKLRGTTMRRRSMPKDDLLNMPLPIPPLSIQKSIIFEVEKINELIRLKKEQLNDYDKLAQSIFYEMFGNPVENEKGWIVKTIGDVCSLKSGDSKANKSPKGTLPYVKVGDMNLPGNENYITCSSTYVDRDYNKRGIFPIGSILFPKRGGAILTNKKRMAAVEICCDLNTMGVIPSEVLNKHYLFQWFKILDLGTICSGSTILQLNNCDIAPLLIQIPPLTLQQTFAKRIELIEQQKAEIQSTIADLETLLASRMQYWFD